MRFIRASLCVLCVGTALVAQGCAGPRRTVEHGQVVVLGFDGMDPRLVETLIGQGRMPNFSRLRDEGGFVRLATSIPPQSPVAWSSFITGANPGVHGIFDFIHRDPAEQVKPYFSTVETVDGEAVLRRGGTPFWDHLDAAGIPVTMYRVPANYPPSRSTHGQVSSLSGMGTPDLVGSQGSFQHFSDRYPAGTRTVAGGKLVHLRREGPVGRASLVGPKRGQTQLVVPLEVRPGDGAATIVVGGEGGQRFELKVGEWSDWRRITFAATPPVVGIYRVYLQQVRPHVRLYVTPLNFDPQQPAARISEPPEFAGEIGKRIGPFYTQGFAEDFKALDNGVFDEAEYERQSRIVMEERFAMLDHALDRFEDGLLYFYFSSSDTVAHLFWWDSDDEHPRRTPEDAAAYHAVVEEIYEEMDRALGIVRQRVDPGATILVMSDHGFDRFRRKVNLNTWLHRNGYVTKLKPVADGRDELFWNIDWSRTRAYAMGLNGLYVNLRGREREGIVAPGAERDALLDELTRKLLELRDPGNGGARAIKTVYRAEEVYRGPRAKDAPDLVIGYAHEYRSSGQSAVGTFEANVIEDNAAHWSADHCMAADLVPGVLLSNRKIAHAAPALTDLAPTILARFGLAAPPEMHGRDVLAPERP